jgi:hypothetical protein
LYYSVSNGYALTDLELSRFDAIVVSSEVGYEKPAPEIFKIALGIVEFNLFELNLYLKDNRYSLRSFILPPSSNKCTSS